MKTLTLILSLGLLFSSQFALAQVPTVSEAEIKKSSADAQTAKDFQNSLIKAIKANDTEEIQSLINQGVDINATDSEGDTPLHVAAFLDHVDSMKLLVENGADVNAQDAFGYTPLHDAALYNKVESVKFLIDSGADVNIQDNDHQTPLDIATTTKKPELMKLLKEHDALTGKELLEAIKTTETAESTKQKTNQSSCKKTF